MGVLVNAIPTIIPVATFLAYLIIRREPLSAAQAFTALSLFNVLRFPLFQLPQIVTQVRPEAHRAGGAPACQRVSACTSMQAKWSSKHMLVGKLWCWQCRRVDNCLPLLPAAVHYCCLRLVVLVLLRECCWMVSTISHLRVAAHCKFAAHAVHFSQHISNWM
eukprot:GHRQ01021027.1.p1 GENE.GHRQ01021027.1~~GHRQ01021027.1.p1  ORF type:complete len:162 (-),score=34.97 GHRQ01021027.1:263-748(-)